MMKSQSNFALITAPCSLILRMKFFLEVLSDPLKLIDLLSL